MGAVAGAGLALLLAPMAGDETRRHIGDAARNLRNGAKDQLDRVKDVVREGADGAGAAIDAGKDAFRQTMDKSPLKPEHAK